MTINSIGSVPEPQTTKSVEETEESKSQNITYTANGVTKTIGVDENELQELDITEEESNEEKIFNSKKDNYEQQLETLQDQLKTLRKSLAEAENMVRNGEDFASANSQIESIRSSISSTQDNINKIYIAMLGLETDLEASTMDFANGGSVDTSNYKFREGATEEGKHVVETALKYDDKSAGEMAGIMTTAGYRYDEGAWCADFASFVLGQAYGGKENVPGDFFNTCANTAYCPEIVNWATGNGSWTTDPNTLQPGDLVLFDWDNDGTSDHIGIFVSTNADGTINTIEGNTSGAAGGSCVEAKIRAPQTILGYSRISGLS